VDIAKIHAAQLVEFLFKKIINVLQFVFSHFILINEVRVLEKIEGANPGEMNFCSS